MQIRSAAAAALVAASLAAAQHGALAQGALSVKGSDTMLALGQSWAAAYAKTKAGAVVTVTGGGSTTGLAALVNGGCDIAQASRGIKASEVEKAKQRGFVPFEVPVARDGLAIIVNPKNPIAKITLAQLKAIYTGAANWSQVGGPNMPVIAIGRDTSSGTYGFVQDVVLGGKPYRADMQTSPSTNAIAQGVAADAGAIGYVGVAYAKAFGSKVRIIPVARGGSSPAIDPTEENVRNGKYPLWRYLFLYTRGKPVGTAKAFVDWVLGPAGQSVAEHVGYYPVR